MSRRSFALALVTVAVACSSFNNGDDTDQPAPIPDAGPGGLEGSAEVGSDAGAHTFFDDFDQGSLGENWFDKRIAAPATMELVGGVALSPPNALVLKYPEHDGGDFVYDAWLLHRFDRPTKSLTCRVRMFIEEIAMQTHPSILNVRYRGNRPTEVDFSIGADGSSMAITQEGADPKYPRAAYALATARWLSLALTIDSDTRDIEVQLDGAVYFGGKFDDEVRPNDGFEIRLGAFTVGAGGGATLRYDDFSCDVTYD
jgi:hypothetical protein